MEAIVRGRRTFRALQDRPRRLEDARAGMDAGLAGRGAGGHARLLHAPEAAVLVSTWS